LLQAGSLYPNQAQLRQVSLAVASAVVREARDSGVGRLIADDRIEPTVRDAMWYPQYTPVDVIEHDDEGFSLHPMDTHAGGC
jgi:malic enzyme